MKKYLVILFALALVSILLKELAKPREIPIQVINAQEEAKTDIPAILVRIGECESGNQQFENGHVKRGKENSRDVGKYQINEFYHLNNSKKLGMDIYTEKGNTDYALYLLKTAGTTPWNWSSKCWNK